MHDYSYFQKTLKMKDTVPEFYRGQKVLLTGGTGFVGKVLVEKILRSCPDIERLYLIIRSKKGKSIEQRWKEVTDKPLFDKLKILRADALKKVTLISGDISKAELGLSKGDKHEIQENVTIVFHAAADVQFTENINDLLIDNVKATKFILDLAVTIKNLKAFVYVSTAYSNFNLSPSESLEQILPSFLDWKNLLKLQETEVNTLLSLKEKLLCGHPNPYTWSKSLAEQIVNDYSEYFPTVVMRPSVVLAALREDPLIGWVDSLNGYSACAIAIFLGIIRVFPSAEDVYNDVIPVDIAARALIISAKKSAETKERIAVYNCGTSKVKNFPSQFLVNVSKELSEIYPVKQKVWVTEVAYINNRLLFSVCFLLWQVFPFMLLDGILKLSGKKTMFLKIAKKLVNTNRILDKFMKAKVEFPIENYETLEDYLDKNDKKEFSIDVSDMRTDSRNIVKNQTLGILKYAMNIDLRNEALNKNRSHLRRIKFLKNIVDCIQYLTIGWLFWSLLKYTIY